MCGTDHAKRRRNRRLRRRVQHRSAAPEPGSWRSPRTDTSSTARPNINSFLEALMIPRCTSDPATFARARTSLDPAHRTRPVFGDDLCPVSLGTRGRQSRGLVHRSARSLPRARRDRHRRPDVHVRRRRRQAPDQRHRLWRRPRACSPRSSWPGCSDRGSRTGERTWTRRTFPSSAPSTGRCIVR